MITVGQLHIRWYGSTLEDALSTRRHEFPPGWCVFVESLDGAADTKHVLRVLQSYQVLTSSAQKPVLLQADIGMGVLSDTRIFSLYDAIWVLGQENAGAVVAPPFNTCLAADDERLLPRDKETRQPVESWAIVQEWMEQFQVFFGFARARYVLEIRRILGRDADSTG